MAALQSEEDGNAVHGHGLCMSHARVPESKTWLCLPDLDSSPVDRGWSEKGQLDRTICILLEILLTASSPCRI